MTGDFIDAARAHAIGLYHRVVPQDRVLPEALALAEKLAHGPAAALAVTKRALEDEAQMSFEQALQYEAEVQAKLMEHPDYREAYEAFRVKRAPKFA
jgi:enoyl-CoA hydratase/carnithine racemase